MSTFIGRFRTNYFRVRDRDAFTKLMSAAGFNEKGPTGRVWSSNDTAGRTTYAFGSATTDISNAIDPFFEIILNYPEFPKFDPEKGYRDMTRFNLEAFLEAHGLTEPDQSETFNRFCETLQKLVAEDDAVVIVEAGYEKLRYVGADATIITTRSITPITFGAYVNQCLKAIMGKDYTTKFDS